MKIKGDVTKNFVDVSLWRENFRLPQEEKKFIKMTYSIPFKKIDENCDYMGSINAMDESGNFYSFDSNTSVIIIEIPCID